MFVGKVLSVGDLVRGETMVSDFMYTQWLCTKQDNRQMFFIKTET